MGLIAHLCFTRLLRDGSREGLRRYLEALTTAVADWEGVDASTIKYRPSDPLKAWCVPEATRRLDWPRTALCRVAASDAVRRWDLSLHLTGAACVRGDLWADDPSVHLDEAADWQGYGDHLIREAIADTADSIDVVAPEFFGSGGHARGYRTGIFLVTKLEAFPEDLLPPFRVSEAEVPTADLIRAVEETLCGGPPCREILSVGGKRRDVRRFLAECDGELLERWGAAEFSRLLAPLGLTLQQWQEAY